MIFEIISGGEKTDWVGKEWAGLFFPRGKNGPAHSFPGEKTDWGEILACYTGIEPATPGLQGKRFIHYTTAAPTCSHDYMGTHVLVEIQFGHFSQPFNLFGLMLYVPVNSYGQFT